MTLPELRESLADEPARFVETRASVMRAVLGLYVAGDSNHFSAMLPSEVAPAFLGAATGVEDPEAFSGFLEEIFNAPYADAQLDHSQGELTLQKFQRFLGW